MMVVFLGVSPLKKLEQQMVFEGVRSFIVTCCKDTDNKIHIPSETKEYSYNNGKLTQMPDWLVQEIYEAMRGKKSQVVLERHIGETMYVKVLEFL